MNNDKAASLKELLKSILNSFMDLCECDGGAIFTLKTIDGQPHLVFEAMITRSIHLSSVPSHLQNLNFHLNSTSLVSKTARDRALLNVPTDQIKKHVSKTVDQILNYETKNMLSAPLVTPRGDLVGVVQLLNKIPPPQKANANFDRRDERFCNIMAGQAALAIENSLLLVEQENLLDGFVQACVTAIESRDPVTSGHSNRVCNYTVTLAEAVNRAHTGSLKDLNFSPQQIREIRYAAMLHDVGKISVKEAVLNKEKKLHAWELELIRMRLKLMRASLLVNPSANRGIITAQNGPVDVQKKIKSLESAWELISKANEPTILAENASSQLEDLLSICVEGFDGENLLALTNDEKFRLSIPKGSLTKEERLEIERHVTHTYEILKMVPWSKGLEAVPEIAFKHHEKLDGTGYPHHCPSHSIPLQSRMLSICDIYDALTADDRPYKRALPAERALDILSNEVKSGKLDQDLFTLFLEAKVFETYTWADKKDRKAA